jgi:hypothetical protein
MFRHHHSVSPCVPMLEHGASATCALLSGYVKSNNVLQRFENVLLNEAKSLPFQLIKKKRVID